MKGEHTDWNQSIYEGEMSRVGNIENILQSECKSLKGKHLDQDKSRVGGNGVRTQF